MIMATDPTEPARAQPTSRHGSTRVASALLRPDLAIPLLICLAQLVAMSTGGADPWRDDAWISLRYADNLASGHGLVFNPGERVEGFTNLLWTLLGAGVLRLGLPPVLAVKMTGGLCALGLLVSARLALADAGLGERSRLVVGVVLATCVVVPYWSLSGLETVPYAWAVLEGTRRFARAVADGRSCSPGGAAALALATLLRPEGAAYVVLLGIATAWAFLRRSPARAGLRDLAVSAGIYLVPVGAWQVVRVTWYGEWLPNTFFAKVGGGAWVLARGLEYLRDGLVETPAVALLLGLAIAAPAARRPIVGLCSLLVAFQLAYVVKIGGDFMGQSRFLVPIVPLLCVAWGAAVHDRTRLLAVTAVAAMALGLLPYVTQGLGHEHDGHLRRYERAADWIAIHTPPDALIATPAIGVIGYVSRRPILDVFGLIDPEIARHTTSDYELRGPSGHDRAHPSYVLSRAPEMVLLGNVWIRSTPMTPGSLSANTDLLTPTDRFLFGMPEFFESYRIVSWDVGGGDWFSAAVRRGGALDPGAGSYRGPPVGPTFDR